MGYGNSNYGISEYGIGGSGTLPPPAVISNLIVQPNTGSSGTNIIVGSLGANLNSQILDDNLSSLSLAKWDLSYTGEIAYNTGSSGLSLALRHGTFDISLRTITQALNASVEYEIKDDRLSEYNGEIIFACMRYVVGPSSVISIERKYTPTFGHHLLSSYTHDNTTVVKITQCNLMSSKLRISAYGNVFATSYDDVDHMYFNGLHAAIGTVHIASSSNIPIDIRFANFKSELGFKIGDSISYLCSYVGDTYTTSINSPIAYDNVVNVSAFNHFGLVGYLASGFTYLPAGGAELSHMYGMDATILGDVALR